MNQTKKCDYQYGCGENPEEINNQNKNILVITWQRLISEGSTCPRCGSTEDELNKAILQLKEKLDLQGIEVIIEKIEMTIEEFKKNSIESNRILFNGRSLEDVIGAKTGHSKCCDVCGDEECRTVEIKEKTYETIPAKMIVKAGLKAVSEY